MAKQSAYVLSAGRSANEAGLRVPPGLHPAAMLSDRGERGAGRGQISVGMRE